MNTAFSSREVTISYNIYIAGDFKQAKQICRNYCKEIGLCVTLEKIDFIFTGGEEKGIKVGLLNYPRFPTTKDNLHKITRKLANLLRNELNQYSYLIKSNDYTEWSTLDKSKMKVIRKQHAHK